MNAGSRVLFRCHGNQRKGVRSGSTAILVLMREERGADKVDCNLKITPHDRERKQEIIGGFYLDGNFPINGVVF